MPIDPHIISYGNYGVTTDKTKRPTLADHDLTPEAQLAIDVLRHDQQRPLKVIKIGDVKHRERWAYSKWFKAELAKMHRDQRRPRYGRDLTRLPEDDLAVNRDILIAREKARSK